MSKLLLLILLITTSVALIAAAPGPAPAPATQPASPPPVAVADAAGGVRMPLELGKARAAVLVFVATDCPISNGYAPELNRICREYEARGTAFYLVYADAGLSAADAKKHAAEYGYACPLLLDGKHELARRLGVRVTPEAAVVGADAALLYRGRIDDLYPSLGKRRYQAATHDLRAALDAVLAGKPAPTPRTAAVGCAIPDN